MSSVQQKDPRNKVLRRQSSFQRIKCQARSMLLGSISSRDCSFIHLLENALNSSRAFVQKPAIVLVIPAVHILCVAMAVCVNSIRKLTGGVSFESLDRFIAEINQLKSKHQSYSVQKEIKMRLEKDVERRTSEDKQEDEARVDPVESFIDQCAIKGDDSKQQQGRNFEINQRFTTFFVIVLAYSQLIILLYLASCCSQLKAGYVFLLVCILSISLLLFKISFNEKVGDSSRVTRRYQRSNRELRSTRTVFSGIHSQSHKIENCLRKIKLL